jgi:uncharacterized protein
VEFEFDPDKSAANLAKHGIDFVTAQELWADPTGRVRPSPYQFEDRSLLVAAALGRLWVAVWTERGAHIRLISVRRARRDEVADYEQGQ